MIDQKKVVITGASRGIGAAIASAFKMRGNYVIGTSTSHGNAKASCNEWIIADFSVREQIEYCAKQIHEISPDILVNNAGINKIASFSEISSEDFLLIQQVNLFAPFRLSQAAIPSMLDQNWGRIINISSIWGKISKEYRASYSASKFALDGVTLALAAEYSKNGILVNSVAPGFTDTELTRNVLGDNGIKKLTAGIPIGRIAKPEEIANLVVWLSSEENSYISGQNIAIDGGFTRV